MIDHIRNGVVEITHSMDLKVIERHDRLVLDMNQRFEQTTKFILDQTEDCTTLLGRFEHTLTNMATNSQIERLSTVDKELKTRFDLEFEQLQDFLRATSVQLQRLEADFKKAEKTKLDPMTMKNLQGLQMNGGVSKGDLDKLTVQVTGKFETIQQSLNLQLDMLGDKVSKTELSSLVSNKIGRDEINDFLPDMETFELRLKSNAREEANQAFQKTNDQLRGFDFKITQLRNEMDVDSF